MRLRRLLTMSVPELVCRGRQETSKLLERTGVARRMNGQPRRVLSLDRFQEVVPSRFFEGVVSEQTPGLIAQKMREAYNQTVAAAEMVCHRRFDLLGYHGLRFGDPVDWHLDPISGRRAPLVHWSRLDPLDPATVRDIKVVWELSRHQWLVHLGQAYSLTEDEHYAEAFAICLKSWLHANPPSMGINWASSLEVALRLISWCWALALFRRSKTLSSEFFASLLSAIQAHASHIERYLSYYSSPNAHLTGEALGLVYAGVLFPEFQAADRWRKLGTQILIEQSERQILADGVYFEQSTCYQRYTAEIYLHFLILAARNGIEIPTTVRERVQRLLDFLLVIHLPDGSLPRIGDADGGWLLPLAPRAAADARGVFAIGAAFFGRPDYAWAAGGVTPEVLWLLGPSGLKAYQQLRPAAPAMEPSCLFPEGGYAVMRGGWRLDAHHLIFDAGPLGCPLSGGHGHADLLSIQCSVFGEPYLVDSGTYCYTADPAWRDFFRSTTAHSTVMLDGAGQAVPAGPFAWERRPQARLRRWLSTEAFDFADAEHNAYCRLSDPVVHRRRVLFVKPRYWLVVDDLQGAAEHRVELRFQFAPMEVTVDPTLWARAYGPRGRGLLIRPFAMVALKAEVREGEVAPIQGWVSPDYGQRRPAPVLIYSAVTCLPLRIVTLLLPIEQRQVTPPAVSPIVGEGPGPIGLIFGEGQETILVDEPAIVLKRQ